MSCHLGLLWRAYNTSSWLTFKRILCSRSRRPDSTRSSFQAPNRQQTPAAWDGVSVERPGGRRSTGRVIDRWGLDRNVHLGDGKRPSLSTTTITLSSKETVSVKVRLNSRGRVTWFLYSSWLVALSQQYGWKSDLPSMRQKSRSCWKTLNEQDTKFYQQTCLTIHVWKLSLIRLV